MLWCMITGPDRPLVEELPPATALRPLLDAVGSRERWAEGKRLIHVVFVPQLRRAHRRTTGNRAFEIVTAGEVLAALR